MQDRDDRVYWSDLEAMVLLLLAIRDRAEKDQKLWKQGRLRTNGSAIVREPISEWESCPLCLLFDSVKEELREVVAGQSLRRRMKPDNSELTRWGNKEKLLAAFEDRQVFARLARIRGRDLR